jgi:hypothetical protein
MQGNFRVGKNGQTIIKQQQQQQKQKEPRSLSFFS